MADVNVVIEDKRKSIFGILSLVFGIFGFIPMVGLGLSALAIVLGIIGLVKGQGKWLNIIGIILGIFFFIINLIQISAVTSGVNPYKTNNVTQQPVPTNNQNGQ